MKTFELCRALRSAGLVEQAELIVRAARSLEELLQSNPARGWSAGLEALERLTAARREGPEV